MDTPRATDGVTAPDAGADLRRELAAIEAGRAAIRLPGVRILRVTGADARGWLHDLITADVASLAPGRGARSLLLTPTGRIRADLSVGRDPGDPGVYWLLQPGDQPEAVDAILSRYVLSSDVGLHEATGEVTCWSLLGGAATRAGVPGLTPSIAGPGLDVLVPRDEVPSWAGGEGDDALLIVSPRAAGAWAVGLGRPRMGVDFDAGALPAEAGLEDAVDFTKGCFLGQESVAKVRNLGHPPTVLRHLRSPRMVRPGATVLADGQEAGTVTAVAPDPGGGSVLLARVGWASREGSLSVVTDEDLAPIRPAN